MSLQEVAASYTCKATERIPLTLRYWIHVLVPGIQNTITDCCALGAAIKSAARGATITVSGIIQLTADQCSPCNVTLPIHVAQDITVNGADLNPDYNVITGRTVFGSGAFVVDENVTASFNRISFREFSVRTLFRRENKE